MTKFAPATPTTPTTPSTPTTPASLHSRRTRFYSGILDNLQAETVFRIAVELLGTRTLLCVV